VNQDFKQKLQDRLKAFSYNFFGKKPLTALERAEFKRLVEAGLIKKSPVDSLKMLYLLGKAYSIFGEAVKVWGTAEINKFTASDEGALTRTDEASLDLVRAEAEGHLEELFSKMGADLQGDYKNRMLGSDAFKRNVRDALTEKITRHQTIQQMASNIGKRTGAWGRDLYRISFTESHNCYNLGTVMGYMKKTGKNAEDIDVAIIPRGRGISCDECVKLYLKPGTNEPRIFKLSEILGNSNVGLKRREWKPCISSTHPFCQCFVTLILGRVWDGKRFSFPKKAK
jgi:hypothetical protein